MMTRTGHGPNDWRDEGPGYGGSSRLGGSLVVGGTRPAKGAGLTPTQAKLDDRPVTLGRPRKEPDEAHIEARRASWRASKRRRRDREQGAA